MTIRCQLIACTALLALAPWAGAASPAEPDAGSSGPPMDAACASPPARELTDPAGFARCARLMVARSRESPGLVQASALDAIVGETLMRSIASSDPAFVSAIEATVDELERRNEATPLQRGALVATLLLNDRYEEARRRQGTERTLYTSAFPRRVPATAPRTPGALPAWTWDARADTLTERAVDLAHGSRVLVWSAPNCHFCEQAATDIEADAALAKAFGTRALWVQRPFSGLEPQAMLAWTKRHPATPIAVVFDPAGWPIPKGYGTPTFVFLRDGRVVSTIAGWPPDHAKAVRDALRAIGLEAGL